MPELKAKEKPKRFIEDTLNKSTKNSKKTLIIILSIIIIITIISLFSTIFAIVNMGNDRIFKGITINNISISGLTKDEASKKLHQLVDKKLKEPLKITFDDTDLRYDTTLDLSLLEVDYNISEATKDAYNIGKSGNIFQNNFEILKLIFEPININIDFSINEKILNKNIENISSNLPNKVIESSYYLEDDKLIITRGSEGLVVDSNMFKSSLNKILTNISSSNHNLLLPTKTSSPSKIDLSSIHSKVYKKPKDAYYEENPFKVYPETEGLDFDIEKVQKLIDKKPNQKEYKIKLTHTKPKKTLLDLDIDIFRDKLSSFSTRYDASNKERSTNLELAASKINETILSPGEEFSYNTIVGERTIDAGYKEAKIYSNGKVIDGLGGGICQISSTLYNAIVIANLEITKRYNHQFVTSYVKAGRDATVAYGSKDFKFKNNRSYPIKIIMTVDSGVAKVELYGIKEEKEYDIRIEIENISTTPRPVQYETDDSLDPDTEKVKQVGSDGIVVQAYKVTRYNGSIISRELLSKDTYNPLPKIILRGPSS